MSATTAMATVGGGGGDCGVEVKMMAIGSGQVPAGDPCAATDLWVASVWYQSQSSGMTDKYVRSREALWANQANTIRQIETLSTDVQRLFEILREFNLNRARTTSHQLCREVRRGMGLERHWSRNPHLDPHLDQEASDSEDDSQMPRELDLIDSEEDDVSTHRRRRHPFPLYWRNPPPLQHPPPSTRMNRRCFPNKPATNSLPKSCDRSLHSYPYLSFAPACHQIRSRNPEPVSRDNKFKSAFVSSDENEEIRSRKKSYSASHGSNTDTYAFQKTEKNKEIACAPHGVPRPEVASASAFSCGSTSLPRAPPEAIRPLPSNRAPHPHPLLPACTTRATNVSIGSSVPFAPVPCDQTPDQQAGATSSHHVISAQSSKVASGDFCVQGAAGKSISSSRLPDLWQAETDFCKAFGGSASSESVCFNGRSSLFNSSMNLAPKGICIEKLGYGETNALEALAVEAAKRIERHLMDHGNGEHELNDNNNIGIEDVYTAGVQRSGQNSTVKVDPVQCSQNVRRNVTERSDHKFVGLGDKPVGTPVISLTQTNIANEDADLESDNHHERSRNHPSVELQQYFQEPQGDVNFSNTNDPLPFQSSQYDYQVLLMRSILAQENMTRAFNGEGHDLQFNKARTLSNATSWEEVNGNEVEGYQRALEIITTVPSNISGQYELEFREPLLDELNSNQKVANAQNNANSHILNCEGTLVLFKTASQNDIYLNGKRHGPSLLNLASLDLSNVGGDGLKKYNGFSRWISKELGKVDDSHMKSSSQSYWNFIKSERLDEYGLGMGESLVEAATAVINILGMLPCEGTDIIPNNERSHTCLLSGLFIGNVKVLVRLSFEIEGPKQVAMKLAVRSEDKAISDAIHGIMAVSDVEIDNLEPKLALWDAKALPAPFDALPVPFDGDTWKKLLSAFKTFDPGGLI
ncbi:hypothetical protein IEQ34_015827 [Dendrobium chrysotoxum]|uniref:Coatomer subunit gamma C-terminal domain-containing protein n=1 Tax=Dendrobium chrysotoxum TaxID=161865 RepID=A0AAV7GJ09_DENCH|nr:hypothetical protein IEQ34_015827 [Dendrobium chrysotoxum]